jgi:hypothetical protein
LRTRARLSACSSVKLVAVIVCFQSNNNMEVIVFRLQLALSVADLQESVDFYI